MVQGPQLALPDITGPNISGGVRRPSDAFRPSENHPQPVEVDETRVTDATTDQQTSENATPEDVVAAFADIGNVEAVAQNYGIRAELVRAESVLQVTQNAISAIESIYADLQELAQNSVDENISDADRTVPDSEFQKLKLQITDILNATVFQGISIFTAGDDLGYGNAIDLGTVMSAGTLLPIHIPTGELNKSLDRLENADLLTEVSARVASELTELAIPVIRQARDGVQSHRVVIQQLYATDLKSSPIAENSSTVDQPQAYLENLSHLVSNNLLAGEKAPYLNDTGRLRDILELTNNDTRVEHARTPQPVPSTGVHRTSEPTNSDFQTLARRTASQLMAQTVPELRDLVSGFVRVDKSSRISELLSEPVEAPNERLLPGNRADEDRVVAATIPTVTELAATPTKIIANSTQNYTPQTEKFGEIRTAPQEVLATRGGLPAVNTPTTLLSSKNGSLTVEKTSVEFPETDYAEDHYQDELIATILDLSQPRNQVTVDVRQSEVSRIGELDVSRRSAGLIHQVRESDARLDVGLSIVRTTYEAPSDQIQDGAAIALDPGAFMAELIRADTMLHVADVAIEQIDLHLDYLIGLAEEAASGDSRDRGALDEMYQAVKSNIIDSLAQTVEVQGENILAGGDGPRGEFVIRLSEGRTIGQEHDIAIPSMRVKDFSPDLFYSTIRTQESASAAIGHIELASADTAETRDMIAEQRTLIRQLITLENSLPGSRRF